MEMNMVCMDREADFAKATSAKGVDGERCLQSSLDGTRASKLGLSEDAAFMFPFPLRCKAACIWCLPPVR